MLTRAKAKDKIEAKINEPDPYWPDKPALVVDDGQTIEKEWGWVFFYNASEYLKSGNTDEGLMGNAPYIVNKITGEIIETGTAYDIEHYINEYESKLTNSE
jgi:hypothetical protein